MSLFVLGLLTAIVVLPYKFGTKAAGPKGLFTKTTSVDAGLPNYDIRSEKNDAIADFMLSARNLSGKSAVEVADIREGFVRGENELRQHVPTLKIEYNADIRIPEVITPDVWKTQIARLTGPSSEKRSEILRDFVKANNELVGVSRQQADELVVLTDYTNPDGNLSYAHLEQRPNGIPVFRSEVKAGFTQDGRIIRVINNLAPGLDYTRLSTDFRDPVDAVRAAARNINYEVKPADITLNDKESDNLKAVFGTGDWATTAEKMYFPTEPGVAVPAWRVLIWQPVNAYYVIVDAATGTMLWRKNIGEDQTQAATYQVYRNATAFIDVADSPAPLSPGPLDPTLGQQAPVIARTNLTLIGNEGTNNFNNNGWVTDGTNITDGNAVEAGVDRVAPDGVDAPQTGSPNRVFSSTWNPAPGSPAPGDDPLTAQAQRGAVIQMFYAMNRYHDELYKRGFTEQAFNFQANNFGRGGVGNDRVSAEGQDSGGTNNANFNTPADGGRGRMQMYLWTGPTPDYDGTADAEVIYHEVTHGTSNRLHGNASGLSTNMARGMGEGWSDWYAEVMLAEPTDPINSIHTTGGYATYLISAGFTGNYYYGIRRFPRAPITFLGPNGKPHNPYTFKYVNAGCNTLIGTTTSNPPPNSAYPRGPVGVTTCDQVHNIGEVWSSMLWEVRDRIVTRLGFTAGTTRSLQIVTDGMKLAPIGPTMLQERDAIIAAASALPRGEEPEASADVSDVREGFRVRGMGFSASIQNAGTGADNTAVTEAFDAPNALITNPISVSDSSGNGNTFPEPAENVLVSVPITNTSGSAINGVVGGISGGVSVNYGNIADGATVTRQIPYLIPPATVCGSTHQITITGTSALGALNPQNFSFVVGTPVGGAPANFNNSAAITINDNTSASPYPSNITVSGLSGNKIIKLRLNGLTHTFPEDIDMLLVGPGGQKFLPMADKGGSGDVSNINLVLWDGAAVLLPTTQLASGEFQPSNTDTTTDVFPAPAPASPYQNPAPAGVATFASTFGSTGSAFNGTWSLYVRDDVGTDIGTISGGWGLTFESNNFTCSPFIDGTVTYGNAIGNPPAPRFVSNVTLAGAGSPAVSAISTFPDGNYSLGGFGAGPYTVSPNKIGGVGTAFSSLDAARISQFVAGSISLTPTQLTVGDVSGNTTVSSFDAAMIAKFVAGPPYEPPGIGQTAKWIFNPTSRTYPSIGATLTGENYSALLMGDVTGNWSDTAPARPANRQDASTAVEAPSLKAHAGGEVLIPVTVQGADGKEIIAYEFALRYDPAVIQPQADAVDLTGTASRGLSAVVNAAEPGLLRVVVYGAIPIDGNGVLLNLRFNAVGAPGSTSPLTWESILFNEGDPGVFVTDGRVELAAASISQAAKSRK
ncbi:MAG: M36 family metallopeptidase [Chloracidobacterium sp.]|nr:M36 family metallopeptidase [Chloracidobacterium sp.]